MRGGGRRIKISGGGKRKRRGRKSRRGKKQKGGALFPLAMALLPTLLNKG